MLGHYLCISLYSYVWACHTYVSYSEKRWREKTLANLTDWSTIAKVFSLKNPILILWRAEYNNMYTYNNTWIGRFIVGNMKITFKFAINCYKFKISSEIRTYPTINHIIMIVKQQSLAFKNCTHNHTALVHAYMCECVMFMYTHMCICVWPYVHMYVIMYKCAINTLAFYTL